ncbi:MAG TPA: hypothetical protein PLW65_03800, partial [Pseudomonadota bacterium]|nr:hypothetical protein [Pseudomonadota bacterium]
PGLGGYPLWDPGEGRSALASREMAAAGRWVVPLLYGEPYYDKPAPFFGLLRAVQAFENGKQDQASNLFQRYMHEACDAATLEAVAILSQQREPSSDGKGASR